MKCELCDNDIGDVIVSLSIRQPNGRLNTLACLKCAEQSPAYCKEHGRPHLGFGDGTTACMVCVEKMVRKNKDSAPIILKNLEKELPPEEFDRLFKWAFLCQKLTGNAYPTCVLRGIITKALRNHSIIKEVIREIIDKKSVDPILGLLLKDEYGPDTGPGYWLK